MELAAGELLELLEPYSERPGCIRCPLCSAPLRVLDAPARIVGCSDAGDLHRLADQAAAAGDVNATVGRVPA